MTTTNTTKDQTAKVIARLVALNKNEKPIEHTRGLLLAARAAGCDFIGACKSVFGENLDTPDEHDRPTHEVEIEITRCGRNAYTGKIRPQTGTLYRFQVGAGMIHNVSRFATIYRTACHQQLEGADLRPVISDKGISACVEATAEALMLSQDPKKGVFTHITATFKALHE